MSRLARHFIRDTSFQHQTTLGAPAPSIQDVLKELVDDKARNDLIFDDVLCALEAGRSPLVITERTAHLETIAKRHGCETPPRLSINWLQDIEFARSVCRSGRHIERTRCAWPSDQIEEGPGGVTGCCQAVSFLFSLSDAKGADL